MRHPSAVPAVFHPGDFPAQTRQGGNRTERLLGAEASSEGEDGRLVRSRRRTARDKRLGCSHVRYAPLSGFVFGEASHLLSSVRKGSGWFGLLESEEDRVLRLYQSVIHLMNC